MDKAGVNQGHFFDPDRRAVFHHVALYLEVQQLEERTHLA